MFSTLAMLAIVSKMLSLAIAMKLGIGLHSSRICREDAQFQRVISKSRSFIPEIEAKGADSFKEREK